MTRAQLAALTKGQRHMYRWHRMEARRKFRWSREAKFESVRRIYVVDALDDLARAEQVAS